MADGRAFHVRAADTGNALSPSVEQRITQTCLSITRSLDEITELGL